MNTAALINALGAQVQDELAARKRTLELIGVQERAVLDNDARALEASTRTLESELETLVGRSRKRTLIVNALAEAWGIAAEGLTLGSIAERFGAGAENLLRQRLELVQATEEIQRANRRLAALTGMHRQIVRDVIQSLLSGDGDEGGARDPFSSAGSLVDAEA